MYVPLSKQGASEWEHNLKALPDPRGSPTNWDNPNDTSRMGKASFKLKLDLIGKKDGWLKGFSDQTMFV